tara:strand:- start:4033 stop:4275 length:243 start_codon:yes stop_codon:yes gene_type:complete
LSRKTKPTIPTRRRGRGIGKIHLTRRGAPKVGNPDLRSIDRGMQKAMRASLKKRNKANTIDQYTSMLLNDGGMAKNTRVF